MVLLLLPVESPALVECSVCVCVCMCVCVGGRGGWYYWDYY